MATELMAPVVQRVRAYFAPLDRLTQQAAIFDPAQNGVFALDTPPAPWIDLGWIHGFTRLSGTVVSPLKTGSPASTSLQTRTEVEASVRFSFESWGKLQMSLSAGTQQMNLLATLGGATAAGSGGTASPAIPLGSGSTAYMLQVSAASSNFLSGALIAVDVDYAAGTTGFIGSGVSGAYVTAPVSDVDYVRRITLNVARISSVGANAITLETPLLAGTPTASMKVSTVQGFCDREGSSFFQEWSALFVAEGQQGERVIWHYPRMQAASGIAEVSAEDVGDYRTLRLSAAFRALPVIDGVDGERIVCFRSYVPGA